MKKILYLMMLICLGITSCVKSPEEKANALIEQHIKSCLFKPDTYENVSTQVDSAFSPYCDPEFYEMLFTLKGLNDDIDSYTFQIRATQALASLAKSSMSIYSDGYSAFSRNEYQKNKESYQDLNRQMQEQIEKKDALIAKKEKLTKRIQAEFSKKPKFIGFQVVHRYRADNNVGLTMLGDSYFIFDKDFTEILAVYDMDSDDYKAIDEMIDELKEEQE